MKPIILITALLAVSCGQNQHTNSNSRVGAKTQDIQPGPGCRVTTEYNSTITAEYQGSWYQFQVHSTNCDRWCSNQWFFAIQNNQDVDKAFIELTRCAESYSVIIK